MYSVLYQSNFLFTVRAGSPCRILTLDDQFFSEMTYAIENMEDCIMRALKFCDDFGGSPMLDFKKYYKTSPGWKAKCKESIRRAIIISKLDNAHKDKFVGGIQSMVDQMKQKKEAEEKALKAALKAKIKSKVQRKQHKKSRKTTQMTQHSLDGLNV